MYTNLIKLIQRLLLNKQWNTLTDIFCYLDVEGSSNSFDEFIEILKICRPYFDDGVGLELRYRVYKAMLEKRGYLATEEVFKRNKLGSNIV